MSTALFSRCLLRAAARHPAARPLTTTTTPTPSASATDSPLTAEPTLHNPPPKTHFKITLRRSGISMGDKIKGTLLALGFHRRHQTVYHPHGPEVAGKILRVKELVEVENVATHEVMTPAQQRRARAAARGYKVVGTRRGGIYGCLSTF